MVASVLLYYQPSFFQYHVEGKDGRLARSWGCSEVKGRELVRTARRRAGVSYESSPEVTCTQLSGRDSVPQKWEANLTSGQEHFLMWPGEDDPRR